MLDEEIILQQVIYEVQPTNKRQLNKYVKHAQINKLFYINPTFQLCFYAKCCDIQKCWNLRELKPNKEMLNKILNCKTWKEELSRPIKEYPIRKSLSDFTFSNYELNLIILALNYLRDIYKEKDKVIELLNKLKFCKTLFGIYER